MLKYALFSSARIILKNSQNLPVFSLSRKRLIVACLNHLEKNHGCADISREEEFTKILMLQNIFIISTIEYFKCWYVSTNLDVVS